MLPVIVRRLGAPEDNVQEEESGLKSSSRFSTERWTLIPHSLKVAGLIEESTVILRKINQTIPSPGVSGERVYSAIIRRCLITK